MDRRADLAALDRRFTRTGVTGNQQDDPVARRYRRLQPTINRIPGRVQTVPVQVDHAIRNDTARLQSPVPMPVQSARPKDFSWR